MSRGETAKTAHIGWLFNAPKIELHLHLEGSLSLPFWEKRNKNLMEEISSFQNHPVRSLPNFLSIFEKIHRTLKSPEDYYEATIDLIDQLCKENILYAEITWAPGGILEFHAVEPPSVFQSIRKAIREKRDQIDIKILVDIIRNQPVELALQIANWLIQEKPREVVGINFGGDEERFKIAPFTRIFQNLKEHGYKLTIHAGESVNEEELMSSIEQVLPHRIGHGTSLRTQTAVDWLIQQNISVEACPFSNESLKYLNRCEQHPIFYFHDLRASLNTDDRSFFSYTLTDEMERLLQRGISIKKIAKMQLQAVDDCFSQKKVICLIKSGTFGKIYPFRGIPLLRQ